jgi:hypothetical protein
MKMQIFLSFLSVGLLVAVDSFGSTPEEIFNKYTEDKIDEMVKKSSLLPKIGKYFLRDGGIELITAHPEEAENIESFKYTLTQNDYVDYAVASGVYSAYQDLFAGLKRSATWSFDEVKKDVLKDQASREESGTVKELSEFLDKSVAYGFGAALANLVMSDFLLGMSAFGDLQDKIAKVKANSGKVETEEHLKIEELSKSQADISVNN